MSNSHNRKRGPLSSNQFRVSSSRRKRSIGDSSTPQTNKQGEDSISDTNKIKVVERELEKHRKDRRSSASKDRINSQAREDNDIKAINDGFKSKKQPIIINAKNNGLKRFQ